MVEPASCGAGRHPRDGAGEPLSRGVHPGIAAGRPSRPGGGIAAVSAHPDSIRARRCRFVLFWRPVACKRGGGVFLNRFSNPIPSTVSVSQGSTTRRAILRTRSAFGSPHLIVHSFLTPLRKFSHGKVFEFVRPRGGCNLRRIVCWIDLNPDACRAHSV